MDPSNCCLLCPLSSGDQYFPRVSSQSGEMLQRLPLEGEEGTESEERENSSVEDLKEIVTLAFVKENTGAQKGLQNALQQGKKRKKRRLGLKDGEWGFTLVKSKKDLGGRGPWLLMNGGKEKL